MITRHVKPGYRLEPGPDAEESRVMRFVLSTNERHLGQKTIPRQDKWSLDYYKQYPYFNLLTIPVEGCWPEKDTGTVIGKSNYIDIEGSGRQRKLIADAQFADGDVNPLAEKAFRSVLYGSIRDTIVEFIEVGEGHWGTGDQAMGEENARYWFNGQELIRWAIINNPRMEDLNKRLWEFGRKSPQFNYASKNFSSRFANNKIDNLSVSEVLILLDGKDAGLKETDPYKLLGILNKKKEEAFEFNRRQFREMRVKERASEDKQRIIREQEERKAELMKLRDTCR
jgi:hypothetical protein